MPDAMKSLNTDGNAPGSRRSAWRRAVAGEFRLPPAERRMERAAISASLDRLEAMSRAYRIENRPSVEDRTKAEYHLPASISAQEHDSVVHAGDREAARGPNAGASHATPSRERPGVQAVR